MLEEKIEILECVIDKIEDDCVSIIIVCSNGESEKREMPLGILEEYGISHEGQPFQIKVEQTISIIPVGNQSKTYIKRAHPDLNFNIFKKI